MSASRCKYPLIPPLVVAIATDKYLKPSTPFTDPSNLYGVPAPKYGQDISMNVGRAAPGKQSVGSNPEDLKKKMRKLLSIFASGDKARMAKRLFDAFLTDTSRRPAYFEDRDLNAAAASHANIKHFCGSALSAPNSKYAASGKIRIHQALRSAKWNIDEIIIPVDLGVPAFNVGSKVFSTGDFQNGLGVMINGVQHAYVVATHYDYEAKAQRYCITLKFLFYDVFGLDDDDLAEFGASSDSALSSDAAIGITAWWQLQHQYGYAPLVTRITLEETHHVAAK
jgi:hypothetical protein